MQYKKRLRYVYKLLKRNYKLRHSTNCRVLFHGINVILIVEEETNL